MDYKDIAKSFSLEINFLIDDILKPCFNFGEYKKDGDIENYVAALVLNKINAILVSIDNSLVCKDIFLSTYLYRYVYELHLKVVFLYIDEDKTIDRLNLFINNDNLKIKNCYDQLKNNYSYGLLLKDHKIHYEMLSSFAHPNIESLEIHVGNTEKQEFDFIFNNLKLSIIHIKWVLHLFTGRNLLNLEKNFNLVKMQELIIRIDNLAK